MHRSLGARERPAPHGKRGGVGGRRQGEVGLVRAGASRRLLPPVAGGWRSDLPAGSGVPAGYFHKGRLGPSSVISLRTNQM